MPENAPAFKIDARHRFRQYPNGAFRVIQVGKVFDLGEDLDAHIEVCKEPAGLADAFGMMTALANDRRNRSSGFEKAVYVIQVEDDPICKIGISADAVARCNELQGAHYRNLFLHAVIFSPTRKAMTIEQAVLARASEEGNRLLGEWVNYEPDEVVRMALEFARDKKIPVCDGRTWFENVCERTRKAHKAMKELRLYGGSARRNLELMRDVSDL